MTDVRVITQPLGGSALSRQVQESGAAGRWLAPAPTSPAGWRTRADARRTSADWRAMLAALAPAFDATGLAAERLARVAREGGVVVTTGQQPGLFGGPMYTWSKAVGALAFADALERATGVPTAAVFWAATDDADFAEASSTVVSRPGGAQVLRATTAPEAGTPMSLAPVGALDDALRGLRDACASAPDPRALDAVKAAYGDPGRTAGAAFVQLLRALLAPLGMPVLDASHDAVHAASRPMLETALRRAADVERALTARGREIEGAGLSPQVDQVPGLSLVFAREGMVKRRLGVAEGASAPTGVATPNVLLRPIVEQSILPTVAYLAGPGELAYFAQVSAVAGALGTESPVALPRWSCRLLEPQVEALLAQLGAVAADLDAPDALETRVARAALGSASAGALDTLRATVVGITGALAPETSPLRLDAAVQGAVQSLQHRIDRLERRLVAGVKRRETAQMRDVATLRGALRPLGHPQERTLNLIPFLARHGLGLLDEMRDAARDHATRLVGG